VIGHARTFPCRCGANLLVVFETEEGSPEAMAFFTCPDCAIRQPLEDLPPGHRVRPETVIVQQWK
jgi:hypothetical protein